MVLQTQTPSGYNEMLGRMASKATKTQAERRKTPERSIKKLKRLHTSESSDEHEESDLENGKCSPRLYANGQKLDSAVRKEVPDSEVDSADEEIELDVPSSQRTDLEQALLPIRIDKEAIKEYEALRAAEAGASPDVRARLGQRDWVQGKSSIYVDAFNLALETVLEDESHLFDEKEMRVFSEWRNLSYEAQYLYVRLFLRKTSAWHRIARIKYYGDIGDLETAIRDLLVQRHLPAGQGMHHVSPGEPEPPDGTVFEETFTFMDSSDEHITTLEQASSLLMLDELKILAKEAKIQGKTKTELITALKRASGRQMALEFGNLKQSDSQGLDIPASHQSSRDLVQKLDPQNSNRDAHFTTKILAETGQCVRLSLAPLKLFERVHLVFYRSTEWTEKSLTTIILARIARRNFPEYIVSRSANIFPSRSLLLEFEAAIRTQFRIDSILEFNGTPTRETLQEVLDVFEAVYPRWQALIREEQSKEDSIYISGEGAYLRRLSPAWVYTRIVHKGAYVLGLGKFKQHSREHAAVSELLAQRLFHASRRGAWYQRKALLEEHYMAALQPAQGQSHEEQKKHWKRVALRTCEEGLQDNLVHLIYHYDLQKRVTKLEKSLKVAKRLQHEFTHSRLSKPADRFVEGIRIERKPQLLRKNSNSVSGRRTSTSEAGASRRGAKTIWLDPRADDAECSVEAMCLSWYRDQGWKGYHSEGGIIRTLFALLFYDVLFTYVPNVFQTPYQTCPLDLHTDAFYATRISEINARLAEIANGGAEQLIREVWAREGTKQTCVIGLDWSFELDDLCEIVNCFGGEKLGTVCKVIAQEYAERAGGVPDLFLWRRSIDVDTPNNTDETEVTGEVCFAEVKSENDRLSDTQRLWIHVLTGAGIRVELCNAVAGEVRVLD